jgi:two-component system, NtrC family, sensor kinase
MKTKLLCLFFLVIAIKVCKAQDSTIVLNASMFDKYFQTISMTRLSGWIFKPGNGADWSKIEIDTAGWVKLDPAQLTVQYADKNGKLEGWLRMRFKLDRSFANMRLGIQASRWAAVDIYIDGNYVTSYGSTGMNGKAYEESTNSLIDNQPVQLETSKEYVLAVHVVDYVAPLNPRFFKTESLFTYFGDLVQLTGPSASKNAIAFLRDQIGYFFLYSGVNGFLSILFWFLYLQNTREKNILFISISTSLFFIWAFLITISVYPLDMDFDSWWLIFFVALQFWPIAIASMVYTVGEIFSFKYKKALVIFGILFVGYSVAGFYFNIGNFVVHPLTAVTLLCYITVSSWKKLKGAQWAVVAGIIFTVIFSFTWSNLTSYYKNGVFPYAFLYQSGMYLSFPISLMIYVAIRFKEILTEVQVNAQQVVQLSKEKEEQAVKQQKILAEEVARQTIELRTSFENLKSTQAQLIQSEKMASLGELTAGIAHEIQNPLNFVNNFSDVNAELMAELKDELKAGNVTDALEIADDIIQNEEKINHHGKRADAIVKGMLQHSRASSGTKELTDINALCDEYLRLSYHGLRAKDKSFNAIPINIGIETNFDSRIEKIDVVPQDIGRVILNLINNAFYEVAEKKKKLTKESYHPTVTVTTKKVNAHKIQISVNDNGNGIPDSVKDKIFQPFFTTKPTGEGTGLGLSLSYDIVKAHGGEIKVMTIEGGGTDFIILLPDGKEF